jgi:catechol 2,3-dioxygenase-like lactoylglutathione lyase family enzyme
MPAPRLARVHIVTRDVPRLARFYEAILGAVAAGSEEYAELRSPCATVAICSQRAVDICALGAVAPAQNRTVILDFEVDDVDAVHARLAGVIDAFVLEPTNQPWGNRAMLFRDPDGNLINFYCYIHDELSR